MATNSWTIPTMIDSMVNHFQLPQQGFYFAMSKAVKNAFGANSLITLLLSKENFSGNAQHHLKILPCRRVQDRVERGGFPTCG
jgi:hypothetical protein